MINYICLTMIWMILGIFEGVMLYRVWLDLFEGHFVIGIIATALWVVVQIISALIIIVQVEKDRRDAVRASYQ